jgi:hypothetical protein
LSRFLFLVFCFSFGSAFSQTWHPVGNCYSPATGIPIALEVWNNKLFVSGGANPGCVGPQAANLISFDGFYFDSLKGQVPGGAFDMVEYNGKLYVAGTRIHGRTKPPLTGLPPGMAQTGPRRVYGELTVKSKPLRFIIMNYMPVDISPKLMVFPNMLLHGGMVTNGGMLAVDFSGGTLPAWRYLTGSFMLGVRLDCPGASPITIIV